MVCITLQRMVVRMEHEIIESSQELMGDEGEVLSPVLQDLDFIRDCFGANERGDGLLLAAILKDRYLYVTAPDDKGEWYKWVGHVWQLDEFDTTVDVAEQVALAYEEYAFHVEAQRDQELAKLDEERNEKIAMIKAECEEEDAKKKIDTLLQKPLVPPKWMTSTIKDYNKRAWVLRSRERIMKARFFAPKVDRRIAAISDDLDQKKWLLPCANGVLDLKRGLLMDGRPSDLLTKQIDVAYNPDADYSFFEEIIKDICVCPEIEGTDLLPAFLKRLFGYAITGNVNEEFLAIFIGPGRNGKGTILETITSVLGAYYHQANRSLFIEQKFEPPPSATSEHMYALQGKRLVVGAETNKGQKIDGGLIKGITGGNKVNYRKNFKSEKTFTPTHTLILETNNIPYGLTKEFSLTQRLVLVDFPFRYVDDIEAEERKYPALKGRFKKKNKDLKAKLKSRESREGVLKWLVEGCLEWDEHGLLIPDCVLQAREDLTKKEDYIGQFLGEIVEHVPDRENMRMEFKYLYEAFQYFWKDTIDSRDNKVPHKNTLSKELKERGYSLEKIGGKLWAYHFRIRPELVHGVAELGAIDAKASSIAALS
ncbi:conserved hypothetical protein [Desulfotalea psychrophila LSv54]|uniref:SF3 helicase domain-containing protein n=2 Tax=Desulfotalea psychrophila TaxID=84980 RepID=Q6AMX4_DESPS|nr:conserved hypothetical protein [Desulfotalea psychrophila LSv54]